MHENLKQKKRKGKKTKLSIKILENITTTK